MLTITDLNGTSYFDSYFDEGSKGNKLSLLSECEEKPRRGIVISARVHPGETNSSWMMQGLIDFLVSDSDYAKVYPFYNYYSHHKQSFVCRF